MFALRPSILSTETTKGEKWWHCSKQAFRYLHINDGVGIALPEVANQEIAIKAVVLLFVAACDCGDLGFLWV
eukprot:1804924-Ditylum_brightwellii.AAC.1